MPAARRSSTRRWRSPPARDSPPPPFVTSPPRWAPPVGSSTTISTPWTRFWRQPSSRQPAGTSPRPAAWSSMPKTPSNSWRRSSGPTPPPKRRHHAAVARRLVRSRSPPGLAGGVASTQPRVARPGGRHPPTGRHRRDLPLPRSGAGGVAHPVGTRRPRTAGRRPRRTGESIRRRRLGRHRQSNPSSGWNRDSSEDRPTAELSSLPHLPSGSPGRRCRSRRCWP
jgi:hypothetical protein